MKSKSKLLVILVLVVIVAVACVTLLMPAKVSTAYVEKRDVSAVVKVTGNIAAGEVETVYAPVSGKISEVFVKAGDTVNSEIPIASYDLTLIENEFNKATSAWEASKKNYESAVHDSNEARAKYEQAAGTYDENIASMEEIMGEINGLEVSNRAGYLTPEERKEVQSLEAQIKDIEGRINVRMADLNGAQGRIENLSGFSPAYVAARAELTKATRNLNAAKAGVKAGSAGEADFSFLVYAGDRVATGDIVAIYTQNGKNVTIKAPIGGTIKDVKVKTGEPVQLRASQTIMTYDTKEYEDAKATAEAQQITARATISSDTHESITRANVDAYNASQDILDFYGDIQANLTKINEINAKAFDGEMDNEEYTRFKDLETELKLVEQRLSFSLSERQFQEGRKLNEYALMEHKFNADMAEADVITAEYNLDLAKSGVSVDKEGVIVERLVNAGGNVAAGEPICTIQYTGVYKVNVMVSKYDIDDIELGQSAKITLGDMKYEGEVSKIFPVAQTDSSGKPKVKVEVTIEDPEVIPTIGLEANVEILAGEANDVLSVPFESVYSDEGGDYVYTLDGTTPAKQYVTVGLKGADYYTIEDGISEGDIVITAPFSDEMLEENYRGKLG